ncbi:MAG: glycerophosphodiester phosphodiesterase [Gemmatimonadales bacterium]
MNPLLDLSSRPIIAHRGASAYAPENTLPSFSLALQQGADALEMDVHLSADGVPMVIHDPTLERTTDRSGAVARLTVEQIREADAGARFSPDGGQTFPWRNQAVRVPTLAEVLERFPEAPILLEIKTAMAQEAVRRTLLERHAEGRCVAASEHAAAVESFQAQPFIAGASGPEIARLYWRSLLGRPNQPVRYRLLSVPVRHRGLPVPTRWFVAAAQELGCPVHVWTVDQPRLAGRLWARGVAGIVTNRPDVIRSARDHHPQTGTMG